MREEIVGGNGGEGKGGEKLGRNEARRLSPGLALISRARSRGAKTSGSLNELISKNLKDNKGRQKILEEKKKGDIRRGRQRSC